MPGQADGGGGGGCEGGDGRWVGGPLGVGVLLQQEAAGGGPQLVVIVGVYSGNAEP